MGPTIGILVTCATEITRTFDGESWLLVAVPYLFIYNFFYVFLIVYKYGHFPGKNVPLKMFVVEIIEPRHKFLVR